VPQIAWSKGGTAEVLVLSNDRVVLRSSIPSPPGSRITGAVTVHGESVGSLWVKIHGSKRLDENVYELVGRPLDLAKTLRERVCAAISPASTSPSPEES
jgi:hypothetical protein